MPACTEPGGKECSTRRKTGALSDAQWIACQHEAWANELIATHLASEGVGWALAHDIDPASGQAPRHRERWPVIAERLARERRQLDSHRESVLADYANYFGEKAAKRFAAFIAARAQDAQGKAARRRSVIRSRPNGGRLGKRIAKYAKLPEKG